MKKNKIIEIIHILAVSSLSIMIFSVAFIGINKQAITLASNRVEVLAPIPLAVSVPNTEIVSIENYYPPLITVHELSFAHDYTVRSENTLSAEDAAEIGAKYIWEVFGVRIDGKEVEMFYHAPPFSTRTYWHGTVISPASWDRRLINLNLRLENQVPRLRFTLDAVSGERIDIMRTANIESFKEVINIDSIDVLSENDQFEAYMQIAKNYATRHFNNSNITSIEIYRPINFTYKGSEKTIASFIFNITDDRGREARVMGLRRRTTLSIDISTLHNDIVPSFRY